MHWVTVITTLVVGAITFGFLWLVTRAATPGVPARRQAVVELLVDFVHGQAMSIYHGASKLVAPLALLTFVLVLGAELDGLLPVDVMAKFTHSFARTGASCPPPTSTRRSRWRCRSSC